MSTSLLLQDKTAVTPVSHRAHLSKAAVLARQIVADGGVAEAAQVDALDENAVAEHLDTVIEQAGGVDISFNAVGLRNTTLQGVPLVDLDVEEFMRPVNEVVRANFLTARLACRHMVANGTGVIMTVTSLPSRIATPLTGGVALAMAAEQALIRDLSVASDRATGIAGTMANLSLGAIPD